MKIDKNTIQAYVIPAQDDWPELAMVGVRWTDENGTQHNEVMHIPEEALTWLSGCLVAHLFHLA